LISKLVTLYIGALGLILGVPAYAEASFAYSDFGNTNPSGKWGYGYELTLTGPFTLNTDYFEAPSPGAQGQTAAWTSPLIDAFLGVYKSATPGDLVLHPGNSGEYAVLRFTAPEAAVYSYSGLFRGFDTATSDIHIAVNNILVYSSTIIALDQLQGFDAQAYLEAGQTLDFLVGYGANANNGNDATALTVTVTSIPEPKLSLGVLVSLAALVLGPRLRRKMSAKASESTSSRGRFVSILQA
jgi:hypothetical protein